jgi:hypothetical protein
MLIKWHPFLRINRNVTKTTEKMQKYRIQQTYINFLIVNSNYNPSHVTRPNLYRSHRHPNHPKPTLTILRRPLNCTVKKINDEEVSDLFGAASLI